MSRFLIVRDVLRKELDGEYVFGSGDCFFMGAAVVDALTGSSLVADHRGSYRTLKGAQRALKKLGYSSLVEYFSERLESKPPALAVVGDIAILDLDGSEHVAVCVGPAFVTKTAEGAQTHPLASCKAAFGVV